MKIHFLDGCRGDGKLYLLYRLREVSPANDIRLKVFLDNESAAPFKLFPLTRFEADYECLIVLFDVAGIQRIVFEEVDSNGNIISTARTCRLDVIEKLRSKFNGVFRKQFCKTIRNFDLVKPDGHFAANVMRFIHDEYDIWTLTVSCSQLNIRNARKLKALLSDGTEISVERAPLSSFVDSDGQTKPTNDVALIMTIPSCDRSLCLASYDSDDICTAMLVLSNDALSEMAKRFKCQSDSAFSDQLYLEWFKGHRASHTLTNIQCRKHFEFEPLFSIIVPLYNTPLVFFQGMIESVLNQTYARWELILVNSSPNEIALKKLVEKYSASDNRIKVIELKQNLGITENTNSGIEAASGDFLCFFDHDDVMEPSLLYEYAKRINEKPDTALLYCDEDKLNPQGLVTQPAFKPDFNFDLLRDNNYICHLLAVKKNVHSKLERATRELDGAQDHSLVLQVAELGLPMEHISKVLYHWRMSEGSTAASPDTKPYATEAGITALRKHLDREGVDALVQCSHGRPFRYQINYSSNESMLEVVLMDSGEKGLSFLLNRAKEYVQKGMNCTVVLEEQLNDSQEMEIENFPSIRILYADNSENWAQRANRVVLNSASSFILFVEPEADLEGEEWERTLLGHLQRPNVGAVGVMVVDASGTRLEAGIEYANGCVFPMFSGTNVNEPGYLLRAMSTQDTTAVGAFCVALNGGVIKGMGGFNEDIVHRHLAVADYCLKLKNGGYKTVYTPEVICKLAAVVDTQVEYRDPVFFAKHYDHISGMSPNLNPNLSPVPSRASRFMLSL